MSDFSEYLDNYMNENSITSSNLSVDIEVDRTLIHRYRKGTRVPSDEKKVLDIAEALKMNTSEKKMLLEKFDLVNLGEAVVYNYQYMKKLLGDLQAATNEQINFIPQVGDINYFDEGKAIVRLNSKDEIIALCAHLFIDSKEKDDITIQMIFQPVYEEILMLMQNTLGDIRNAKIEHILCLEKNPQKSFLNLEIFGKVIPLAFREIDYNTYFYYDSLINHVNETSLLPNMLIVDDIVLQFDYEMNYGIAVKDIIYLECMRKEFVKIKNVSEQLLFDRRIPLEWLQTYNSLNENATQAYSIYFQPCFGYCSSTDLFEKYLFPIPDRDIFIKNIEEHHGNWEGMKWIPPKTMCRKITAYCKEDGIRDFMETGRIGELPKGVYNPLNMDVRSLLIKRLIHLIKSDIIEVVFVDESIPLSNDIYVYWNDNKQVFIHKYEDAGLKYININLNGFYRSVQDFLDYMEKKNMLKTKEEVIERIEKIMREYD